MCECSIFTYEIYNWYRISDIRFYQNSDCSWIDDTSTVPHFQNFTWNHQYTE